MESKHEMPTFDPAALRGMSEEQLDEYGRQYTEAVESYVRESVAESLVPVMEDMGRREQEQAERTALLELRENGDYYDFEEKLEEAKTLCEGMPALSSMDAKERYTAAYLMVKGAEALAARKSAPARAPKEIADEIWENPEVMRLLAERKAKEAAGDLPVFARSAAGAATVPTAPKTLADASAQARKHFKI